MSRIRPWLRAWWVPVVSYGIGSVLVFWSGMQAAKPAPTIYLCPCPVDAGPELGYLAADGAVWWPGAGR